MATRTISVVGGNWDDIAAWTEAAVPVAGDAVVATALSANLTVNVPSACASMILTGYVGTLTFDNTLTLTSTCTLVAGMTVAGTAGTLIGTGTSTWTSAGKTLTCALTLQASQTYTLADSWTVNGLVTLGSTTTTTTVNGNTINCNAGITKAGTTSIVTGTTVLKMTGTGTLSVAGTGQIRSPVTFDAAGSTLTLSGTVIAALGVWTYVAGTLAGASTPTLNIVGSQTLTGFSGSTAATGQMQWDVSFTVGVSTLTLGSNLNISGSMLSTVNYIFSGAFNIIVGGNWQMSGSAITMSGDITVAGAVTFVNTGSTTFTGAFLFTAGSATISGSQTITLANDLQITGLTTSADANVINGAFNWKTGGLTTTGALTGTTTILFNGTGTWQGAAACSNNVTINTAGTLTLAGTVLFAASGTPTLTYTAGTVVVGASILSIASSCTLVTAGITWFHVRLTAAATLTLSSALAATTLTMPDAAVTFAGASGWTVGTFTNATITATRIWTFQTLVTYTITTAFTLVHAAAQTVRFTFTSSSGATRALITLVGGASQDVGFADPTRIDSSGGLAIFTYHGVITDTINWNSTFPTSGGLRGVGNAS